MSKINDLDDLDDDSLGSLFDSLDMEDESNVPAPIKKQSKTDSELRDNAARKLEEEFNFNELN
jgi:hypothetical protein